LAGQQDAKAAEGRESDSRAILGRKLVARHRIQHPRGDGDLLPVGQADHHDVGMSAPETTDYLNCGAEERMVTVRNP